MPSEFLKLYRELSRKGPDSKVYDLDYRKDREEVLFRLGYRVDSAAPDYVAAPRYHGKLVRRRRDEQNHSKLWDTGDSAKVALQAKKALSRISATSVEMRRASAEIETYMTANRKIPDKLIDKLCKTSGTQIAATAAVKISSQQKRANSEGALLPPLVPATSIYGGERQFKDRRTPNLMSKSYSSNKWSTPEINRINALYQEVAFPNPRNSIELWRFYFIGFAERYQAFFPHRSIEETTEKLHRMIASRQFKEAGEREFWEAMETAALQIYRRRFTQKKQINLDFLQHHNAFSSSNMYAEVAQKNLFHKEPVSAKSLRNKYLLDI